MIKEKGTYYDFLRIADGVRCGAIDIWSYHDMLQHQYMVVHRKEWLCIGQVDYIPLLLNKDLNNVYFTYLFYEIFYKDDEVNEKLQWISSFYDFVVYYLFGEK